MSKLSKLEKGLYKQIYRFLSRNKPFPPSQFSFREKRSCIHAVCEVTDYIRSKIDETRSGNACFIDIRKAFDTLDHKTLFFKNMEKYGFRGYTISRRTICQTVGNTVGVMKSNLPSILGPYLILLYIKVYS